MSAKCLKQNRFADPLGLRFYQFAVYPSGVYPVAVALSSGGLSNFGLFWVLY